MKIIMYKIILLVSLVVISLAYERCMGYKWEIPKGNSPVPTEIYERDKSEVLNFMYNNLEYYRQNHDSCLYKSPSFLIYRPAFFVFRPYTERYNKELGKYRGAVKIYE